MGLTLSYLRLLDLENCKNLVNEKMSTFIPGDQHKTKTFITLDLHFSSDGGERALAIKTVRETDVHEGELQKISVGSSGKT